MIFLKMVKLFFRKKYFIRYIYKMNNPPYNDVYFAIGDFKNKGTDKAFVPDKDYETTQLWSKKSLIRELNKRPFLLKEDIIKVCCFKSQKEYLERYLK